MILELRQVILPVGDREHTQVIVDVVVATEREREEGAIHQLLRLLCSDPSMQNTDQSVSLRPGGGKGRLFAPRTGSSTASTFISGDGLNDHLFPPRLGQAASRVGVNDAQIACRCC